MLNPTLLDQSRTPSRAVTQDSKLKPVLSPKEFRSRVAAEARELPKPNGRPPRREDESLRTAAAERSFAMKRGDTPDPDLGRRIFERIIKGNDLVPVNYLERGVDCARAVCRVRLLNSTQQTMGFATGFMVARGVLLTNQHVLPTAAHARFARVEFGFEHDVLGGDRVPESFELNSHVRPIIRGDLDFCLAAVNPRSIQGEAELDHFGWLVLDPTPGKTRENEYLSIIQHPGGERKQICVRENKLIKYTDHTLWYQTDTVAGSSGSPVFNNSWQVAALHHSGVPLTNAKGEILTTDGRVYDPATMKETLIGWTANEGIRISAILACLREDHAEHQLAQAVLAAVPCRTSRTSVSDAYRGASVTVPVFVGSTGAADGRPLHREARGDAPFERSAVLDGFALEVKKPTQFKLTDYPSRKGDDLLDRKGYQPNFLGSGKLIVPKPTIKKKHAFNKPLTWGPGGNKTELPYTRHTVLLSAERRLAVWAAVNVDDNLRHAQPKGKGDPPWLNDPRLDGGQIGEEFYRTDPGVRDPNQPAKRKSPFDRGHQVQQEDATWGKTVPSAALASVDTFYFPNCAPQIIKFNQSGQAWQGLEDYCIEVFAAETRRACVISGAVFDAPKAGGTPKADTLALPLNPNGKRVADPKFLGVRVPKAFYKIVVCSDGQRLRAAAFLMSQQFQLDRLRGTPIVDVEETLSTVQAKIFFVTIQDVSSLTGLDFGANVIAAQDTTLEAIKLGQGSMPGTEVRSLADLRL
jgi:endonuclease G